MRKKYEPQMTVDDHIFLQLGDYIPEDRQLSKMSAILDENPELLEAVARDLRLDVAATGAEGMTAEQVLRSAILYQMQGYPYRELEARLSDSFNFRKFTRFYSRPIPHFSNLEKAIKKIRPETWQAVNDLLVQYAIKKKVESGGRLRADATVVETNIHYPTDASLLEDGVRVLDRLMRAGRDYCPSVIYEYHNRTKRVKKLAYKIAMAKGPHAEKNRAGWYRELLPLSREVLALARGCRAALGSARLSFDEETAAKAVISGLDEILPHVEATVSQCERRVKAGEKVPAAEKIVSIFEPHTDIICRGKTQSPAEFGHKVMAATGASGLVLQYEVCAGNRPDDEYFEGLLKKHVEQFGQAPSEFAADRRFYHERNEKLAAEGPYRVERLAVPKPGRRSRPRIELEKEKWFKGLLRFRAGIEGGLSTLLRCFGWGRCLWRGLASFGSWVGLSVFAYNLRKLAVLV